MCSIFKNRDCKSTNSKRDTLNYLIHNRNATIADLAKALGLSMPTTSKIVNELLNDGFVGDCGKLETDEGRHPQLYGLNPSSGYFVGVDFSHEAISVGISDFTGKLTHLEPNQPFVLGNDEQTVDEIVSHVKSAIRNAKINAKRVKGGTVNISGRVNSKAGYSYSFLSFSKEPLTKLLTEKSGIPFGIENDTRAMAYGELLQGCAQGEQNVLFINLSWGLGMGIISNGKLYGGKSGFAGELGHIHAFDNELLCHCGKKGCLETECSGQAFARIANERIRAGETSRLKRGGDGAFSQDALIEATRQEDPLCLDIIEGIGRKLGIHVANLINLFNPGLVILGGSLSETGDYILQPTRTSLMKYSLNLVNRDSKLKLSALGNRAGVTGACLLARKAALGE